MDQSFPPQPGPRVYHTALSGEDWDVWVAALHEAPMPMRVTRPVLERAMAQLQPQMQGMEGVPDNSTAASETEEYIAAEIAKDFAASGGEA